MAEATKKQTSQKSTTKTTPKADLKGSPEVSRAGITPKGSTPTSKVVTDTSTPMDLIAKYSVVGNIWTTTLGCAVGAWYGWGDDWISIAHLYWPMLFWAGTATFLVFHRFSRE